MNNSPNNNYFLNPKFRFLNYFLFVLAYVITSSFVYHFGNGFGGCISYIAIVVVDFSIIYLCVSYLIPLFIVEKQKPLRFLLALIFLMLLDVILNFLLQNYIIRDAYTGLVDAFIIQSYTFQLSFVYILGAVGLSIFTVNFENQKKLETLEREKVIAELSFLKTQINPHFLFNVLNNIYIQTRIDAKKSSEMVLKLSDLLRYQLYECTQDEVFLKAEVEYLNNYVELQKMRISNIDVKFEQKGSFKGLKIYPFLIIPIIENSFKYCPTSKTVDNFIHVFVDIVEKNVTFTVKNSKTEIKSQKIKVEENRTNNEESGFVSMRKRLELLYSGKHSLIIENNQNNYIVKLKINLE